MLPVADLLPLPETVTVGTDALLLGLSDSVGVGVDVPSHGRVAKTGNNATDRIFDAGWNEHLASHNPR